MTIREQYMDVRRKYLKQLNAYKRQGWVLDEKFKPDIPKKPTLASIRRLNKLRDEAKRQVKIQKSESGYTRKIAEAREARAKQQGLAMRRRNLKKKGVIPKGTTGIPTPPKVSDAILRQVESEIQIAINFTGKSSLYNEAVRQGAQDLMYDTFIGEGNFATYRGDLEDLLQVFEDQDARVILSKAIDETGWFQHFQRLENYLYEYEYADGGFTHKADYLQKFAKVMNEVSTKVGKEISDKVIEDLADEEESEDGFIANNIANIYT